MCISSYNFQENNPLYLDKLQSSGHPPQSSLSWERSKQKKKQVRAHKVEGKGRWEEQGVGSFIPSPSKYLLGSCYVPGPVLGIGDSKVNKTCVFSTLMGFPI